MELTRIELLFLRRLVGENLEKKLGRVQYYYRQLERGNKDCLEKLAIVEAECNAMASLKNKINDEIALRELI